MKLAIIITQSTILKTNNKLAQRHLIQVNMGESTPEMYNENGNKKLS